MRSSSLGLVWAAFLAYLAEALGRPQPFQPPQLRLEPHRSGLTPLTSPALLQQTLDNFRQLQADLGRSVLAIDGPEETAESLSYEIKPLPSTTPRLAVQLESFPRCQGIRRHQFCWYLRFLLAQTREQTFASSDPIQFCMRSGPLQFMMPFSCFCPDHRCLLSSWAGSFKLPVVRQEVVVWFQSPFPSSSVGVASAASSAAPRASSSTTTGARLSRQRRRLSGRPRSFLLRQIRQRRPARLLLLWPTPTPERYA